MRHAAVLLVVGALLAGCTGPAPPSPAAGVPAAAPTAALAPPLEKFTLAYASTGASWSPAFVAAESGLFAKHGLDVELAYIASGTTVQQSLVSGDLKFVMNSGSSVVAAHVGGAPVQILLGWVNVIPVLFMVDPSISTPAQLKGKTVGITRFGSQPHFAARAALQKWGLDPDNDVQYLQLGGVPEILGGMQAGAVVGGAFSPPTNVLARRLGYRVLGDLSQMGIEYQASCLTAMQDYVEANPEAVRRFARALVEGIQVSLTDDAATRVAVAKYTHTDEVELLDEAIAYYRSVVQRIPYPTLAGIQTILDDLASSDPRARTFQPRQMVNTAALEQLEREGFFRQVYGE